MLRDASQVVARVSRGDLNKPGVDSEAMGRRVHFNHFELEVYDVIYSLGSPFCGRPLYHREPKRAEDGVSLPNQGRGLFLFEVRDGETFTYIHWRALAAQQKVYAPVALW